MSGSELLAARVVILVLKSVFDPKFSASIFTLGFFSM